MPRHWLTVPLHLLGLAAKHSLSLILPPTCLSCDTPVASAHGMTFCAECYRQLPRWDTTRIVKPTLPPHIASMQAPFLYQGFLRKVLIRYKFSDHPQFATTLARQMAPLMPPAPTDTSWLIVPVPMHPTRLRQRGFNQSLLLARKLAHITKQDITPTGLTRTVLSESQAKRTRSQRQRLPASHFQSTAIIDRRHILLVDDIYTTGATARACALALKRGGALSVHVLTLAYTPLGYEGPDN